MDKQITAYLHNLLTQAERQAFEDQMRVDAALRQQVAAERVQMQRVVQGISAEMRQLTPPASMTFEAIAPRLAHHRPRSPLHERFATTLLAVVAMLVLSFAIIYSLPSNQGREVSPNVQVTIIAPNQWDAGVIMTGTVSSQGAPTILTRTPSATPMENPTIPTRTPGADSNQ